MVEKEKKEKKERVGVYLSANHFQTEYERKQFPSEKYPLYISIDYKGIELNQSLRATLSQLPKDKARYRHKDYYGTRYEIFLSDREGVKRVLNNKHLKESEMYVITNMGEDKRVYAYQLIDEAQKLLQDARGTTRA